jgi:hypothetical protein
MISRARASALLFSAVPALLILTESPSRADTDSIPRCIAQYDQGIALRNQGKLLLARRALSQCATAACGADVGATCEKEAGATSERIPTIAFATKNGSQLDITSVSVTIDGVRYPGKLAGNAIPLDPGEHEFRFETSGEKPVSLRFVLIEGEHNRKESVLFGPVVAPPSPPPPPPPPAPSQPPASVPSSPGMDNSGDFQRSLGSVVLAVGIPVGIVACVTYGVLAAAKWQSAQNDWTNNSKDSARSELNDARSAATISTASIIGAGVSMVGGLLLRMTAPSHRPLPAGREAIRLEPLVAPGSAGALLSGRFQ